MQSHMGHMIAIHFSHLNYLIQQLTTVSENINYIGIVLYFVFCVVFLA